MTEAYRPEASGLTMLKYAKFQPGLVVQFCCLLLLAGCATTTTLSGNDVLSPLSEQAQAFVASGSFQYTVAADEIRGEYGCRLEYESYRPTGVPGDTMVFLAPGFLRSLKTMRGWAEHWASHGIAVTVMSPCNSNAFDGHHDRNAQDMVTLASQLHEGPRIYAGFSAGGLAAYLAASSDPQTVAYLGLDSVDNKGLALATAPQLEYPALLLIAEPSACNAKNNILDAAAGLPFDEVLRISMSTHCHFEYPYDSRCEIACGSVKPAESQAILIDTVRSLATAWIVGTVSGSAGTAQEGRVLNSPFSPWDGPIEVINLK